MLTLDEDPYNQTPDTILSINRRLYDLQKKLKEKLGVKAPPIKSYKINYLFWLHNVPLVPIVLHKGNCKGLEAGKLLGVIVRLKHI